MNLTQLKAAFALPAFDAASAQAVMSPHANRLRPANGSAPRQAAVLVLIYPEADDLHIVLTRRNPQLRGHSGQISFPGGQRDSQDDSFVATALRETCEELGLCDPAIEIIGALSTVYIPPSNFEVFPIVAYLPKSPVFDPNPDEVAEVFTLPLAQLLDPHTKSVEEWDFQNMRLPVPFYTVHNHKVWGATAVMLSELEARLRAVVSDETRPVHEPSTAAD
jgi:8-oxo-dGTP pyrophosphatase MutT (NUDIX family)